MSSPIVSVINFSTHLEDHEVHLALRAVNRQIAEDFAPIWGCARTLLPQAISFDPANAETLVEEPVQGSGVVYMLDEASVPAVLGFHDLNARHLPVGFVFVLDPSAWSAMLSHEILDLMIDPMATLFVPGPDPRQPARQVLHAYDVCDAVERTCYRIDGIEVSNFVTPSYFATSDTPKVKNDFLGVGLESFGATVNSRISFYDLEAEMFETFVGCTDPSERVPALRAKMYEHQDVERPSDLILQTFLRGYRESLPTELKPGLPQLRGISRFARYSESARCLRKAVLKLAPKASPLRSVQRVEEPSRNVLKGRPAPLRKA